jgi:tol-pal system protein YbgF
LVSEVAKVKEEKIISPTTSQEPIKNSIDGDVDQEKLVPVDIIIADENLPLLVDKNIELDEFSEAKALLRATKYKEAFEAFDRFVINYPKSELISEAKYNLGYSQFTLKNYKAAIKTYSKILKLHPESSILPDAFYGIANCQIQLTRITKAKKTLRNLIKKFPNAEIIPSAKRRLKALESIKL